MARVNDDRDDVRLPDETSISTESATTDVNLTPAEKAKQARDEKLLRLARKQFATSRDAFQHFRTEAIDDSKFRVGTWGKASYQWPTGMKEERDAEGRPALTINRAPSFIRQVTNTSRSARLRIQVKPVNDKADPKVAEVLQGLIRNVEIQSAAETVYATGVDKQAEIGLGWVRIVTEWADDEDDIFRQRIRLKEVRNSLSVYPDPAADSSMFVDGKFLFKVTDVDADRYEEITGEKAPTQGQIDTFSSDGDASGDWFPGGKFRIAEWFHLEAKGPRQHKALLASGKVIDYPTEEQQAELTRLGDPMVRERWKQPRVMMWRKITALKILEETEWGVKTGAPFFALIGDRLEVNGEIDFRGVTRDSKDAARVYNVQTSALTEAVGRTQRRPIIGYRGQFGPPDSHMRKAWAKIGFLEIDPVDIDGKPAPIPQYPDVQIAPIVEAIRQTDTDYKSTAGFRDASLGERGPQESGEAIRARQQQDELGSSHYMDNERATKTAIGRHLIALFRVTYDVPTVHRITGTDDAERNVMIFSGEHNDPRQEQFLKTHPAEAQQPHQLQDGTIVQPGQKIPFQLPEGVKEIYNIGIGEFDIECSAGQDNGTRREQAVGSMTDLFKSLPPEIAAKFLDLYFLMMDFPMAQQMSERAKRLLPPELQDQEDGSAPLSPQVQAKITKMQQMIQQLQEALQKAGMAIQTKQIEQDGKLKLDQQQHQGKLAIAQLQEAAESERADKDREVKLADAELSAKVERMALFLTERARLGVQHADLVQDIHNKAHDLATMAVEHAHQSAEAAKGRAHEIVKTTAAAALAPVDGAPTDGGAPTA